MSNRNNTQRRVARRFKRTQRATQHHQRGNAGVLILLTLLIVVVVFVGSMFTLAMRSANRQDMWVDRCQHIGGEAVQGVNRVMYCIKRDALLVPQ